MANKKNKNMDEFIEYQRFPSVEEARILTDLLDVNYIPFKINDSNNSFDMSGTSINPLETGVSIQIRDIDKDKVDKLNERNTEPSLVNDHYIYSLSDNDIIDAVVNPEEWTNEEHLLAKEIMRQRNLVPTAEIIKTSRSGKIESKKYENVKQDKLIAGGASWFLWIGILSLLNIVLLIAQQNIQFIMGLGINYVILGVVEGVKRSIGINLYLLGYVLTFLVSTFFWFIWKKSKSENKTVYLVGLILYGLDSLIFIFTKEWFSFGFHVFAFLMLANGYNALIAKKRETHITT